MTAYRILHFQTSKLRFGSSIATRRQSKNTANKYQNDWTSEDELKQKAATNSNKQKVLDTHKPQQINNIYNQLFKLKLNKKLLQNNVVLFFHLHAKAKTCSKPF